MILMNDAHFPPRERGLAQLNLDTIPRNGRSLHCRLISDRILTMGVSVRGLALSLPEIGRGGSSASASPIWRYPRRIWCNALAVLLCAMSSSLMAQQPDVPSDNQPPKGLTPDKEELSPAPAKVDVNPVAHDDEIRDRLLTVLEATNWFTTPDVRVDEGVVFLSGTTKTDELKKWAGDLARNTQDVVAVANGIVVSSPPFWDFEPAWSGLLLLWRDSIRSVPFALFGVLILLLSAGLGNLTARLSRSLLPHRLRAKLLRNTISRALGVLVFLMGVYIVLRVSGLTQLALTVVGGTGLIGLAFGIAFREITENFLASIFLSMQRPFETGDLIEVSGVTGYVQQLNVRVTILMTLDGNLVQIPNSTVYKSILRNFSTNANRREDFPVGISYDGSISEAQEIARNVLAEHPAVLQDPEPFVLVDGLGASTVNLRVYFWLNGHEHSWLKVRSSVIRLVKLEFQKRGIGMPDEAREVVFPKGVPITIQGRQGGASKEDGQAAPGLPKQRVEEAAVTSSKSEGGLASEAGVIKEQALQAQPLQEIENLLKAPEITKDKKQPIAGTNKG